MAQRPFKVGDKVTDYHGAPATVTSITEPHPYPLALTFVGGVTLTFTLAGCIDTTDPTQCVKHLDS